MVRKKPIFTYNKYNDYQISKNTNPLGISPYILKENNANMGVVCDFLTLSVKRFLHDLIITCTFIIQSLHF